MRFQGQVAIITGAASGIGKETSARFAREGAAVALVDRNEASLSQVKAEIEKEGGRALALPADVSDPAQVDGLVDEVVSSLGRIDVLVNNAGIARDAWFKDMTDAAWHEVLSVNLGGTFHCSRAVVPHMIEQGSGKIISISSIGYLGNLGCANYNASKAAIVGLTRSMALELGKYGINVNAIAPGFIDTPMTRIYPERLVEKYLASVPLKRPGTPADIARVVLFLASEDAAYITGQVIFVCGGMSVGRSPA